MLSERTQTAVIDAKLALDKVVNASEGYGWLDEVGIAQQDLYNMWFAIDEIIKQEPLSYDMSSGAFDNMAIEHWTEIDSALQTARDILYDEEVWEEISLNYSEVSQTVQSSIEAFGINY